MGNCWSQAEKKDKGNCLTKMARSAFRRVTGRRRVNILVGMLIDEEQAKKVDCTVRLTKSQLKRYYERRDKLVGEFADDVLEAELLAIGRVYSPDLTAEELKTPRSQSKLTKTSTPTPTPECVTTILTDKNEEMDQGCLADENQQDLVNIINMCYAGDQEKLDHVDADKIKAAVQLLDAKRDAINDYIGCRMVEHNTKHSGDVEDENRNDKVRLVCVKPADNCSDCYQEQMDLSDDEATNVEVSYTTEVAHDRAQVDIDVEGITSHEEVQVIDEEVNDMAVVDIEGDGVVECEEEEQVEVVEEVDTDVEMITAHDEVDESVTVLDEEIDDIVVLDIEDDGEEQVEVVDEVDTDVEMVTPHDEVYESVTDDEEIDDIVVVDIKDDVSEDGEEQVEVVEEIFDTDVELITPHNEVDESVTDDEEIDEIVVVDIEDDPADVTEDEQNEDEVQFVATPTLSRCASIIVQVSECKTPDPQCLNTPRGVGGFKDTVSCKSFSSSSTGTMTLTPRSHTSGSRLSHTSTDMLRIQPGCRVSVTGRASARTIKLPVFNQGPPAKVTLTDDAKKGDNVACVNDDAPVEASLELQTRAKTMGGPTRGIVWPLTMEELSQPDRVYYTEAFLSSIIFQQRLKKMVKGSRSWMNGLTQFQSWVIKHDGTQELEDALRPVRRRRDNAKVKVAGRGGKTPLTKSSENFDPG